MTAKGNLRGWEIYYDEQSDEWRFVDNDEPTRTTWFNRPCGHCGLFGSSNEGEVDPCLGFLPGVTNACCGHGDPTDAYICFQGGLVVRGFEVDEFHHRQMYAEELSIIKDANQRLRKFRTYRTEHLAQEEGLPND